MSIHPAEPPAASGTEQAALVDFERLWHSGQRPQLAQFVAQRGPVAADLLAALAVVDQEQRWQHGDHVPCEEYLERFPQLVAAPESAVDVVYAEYLLRERLGEAPDAAQFLDRFPQYANPLRMQIELHEALAGEWDAADGERSLPDIPHYELLRELGRGGMGVVYLARQTALNRIVAIKMLLAGSLAGRGALARLRTEAEAVARLQHPNIVQIYEVGEHAGAPYLVLEFVPGGTLQQFAAGKPQPPRWAAGLVERLARAVDFAHQHGVVHRDLTPANVLFAQSPAAGQDLLAQVAGEPGESVDARSLLPKIADFGLAKQLDAQRREPGGATQTGDILGTPSYMAPEQARGQPHQAGPAVDIHALGGILYELLTGHPPFHGAGPLDTLQQVATEEPLPISRLRRGVPRDLQTICLKCLEKDPRNRYSTAGALADDLERFRLGRPVHARPLGRVARTWRWCRRKPAVAALAGLIATALIATPIAATFVAVRESRQRSQAETSQARAERAEVAAEEKLVEALVRKAQALRDGGRIGRRFESLRALEEAVRILRKQHRLDEPTLVSLRSEAIACLTLADLRPLAVSELPLPADVTPHMLLGGVGLDVDPSFERYALADLAGQVHLRALPDHREMALLPGAGAGGSLPGVFFSPRGRYLAVASGSLPDAAVTVWNVAAGAGAPSRRHRQPGQFLGFSLDGQLLAIATPDGSVCIRDLSTDQEHRLAVGTPVDIGAFSPDRARFAVGRSNSTLVEVFSLASNQRVAQFEHPDEVLTLAWGPDGRLLATGCFDRHAYVWDVELRRQQAVLKGHERQIIQLAFQPHGDLLVTGGRDGEIRVWDPIDGRLILTAPGRCLGFRADGGQLATSQANRLEMWEVAPERERRILHQGRHGNTATWEGTGGAERLDVSPDGRLLAAGGPDGVRILDVATGQELGHLCIGFHEGVLFDPSGDRLYTHGRTGLRIWPLQASVRDGREILRVGPPRLLAQLAGRGMFRLAASADGRRVVASDFDRERAVLFDRERPDDLIAVDQCPNVHTLSISPDGAWVAGSPTISRPLVRPAGVGPSTVKIWRGDSGELAHEILTANATVAFTPDGRWLAGGGPEDVCLWSVGTWQLAARIPRGKIEFWHSHVACSPDGRRLALTKDLRQISLVVLQSRRPVATLSSPFLPCANWMQFTPDSQQLAVVDEAFTLQLWNLQRINRELGKLQLEWDASAERNATAALAPLGLEIWPDVLEAESLPAIASGACSSQVQDTPPELRRQWSGGRQLHCRLAADGCVELRCDVPIDAEYGLDVVVDAQAPLDELVFRLDDRRLTVQADSVVDPTATTKRIDCGRLHLRAGTHRLTIALGDAGAGAAARSLGIDCLHLLPSSETVRVTVPAAGSDGK